MSVVRSDNTIFLIIIYILLYLFLISLGEDCSVSTRDLEILLVSVLGVAILLVSVLGVAILPLSMICPFKVVEQHCFYK